MPQITITKKIQKHIYEKEHILIEEGDYAVNKDVFLIESPSTVCGVRLQFPFKLGAFSHINPTGFIQNCEIGRYCAIARNVKIGNGNHPTNWMGINSCQFLKTFHEYDKLFDGKIQVKEFQPRKYTIIGNDVWIGANVYIKDGVTIGDGAIIGANSVVTHDVEPYAIVAGCPAKLIRYRFSPEIIKELLELQWWNYNIADFGAIDFDDIEKAISQLKEVLPTLEPYKPKHVINSTYLTKKIPYRKQLFGLLTTTMDAKYKYKNFCGIRILKIKIKKKGK